MSLALTGGFPSPERDAAIAFRAIMSALARPGSIETVAGVAPPEPMSVAAGAILLTLCDGETPIYLGGDWDTQNIRKWITFHTNSPIVTADQAKFALGDWNALLPLDQFKQGQPDYPDRSATLIVEMSELTDSGATLTGPGIKTSAQLSLPELARFQSNAQQFPLGLDFFLTCDTRLAGLPRTTKVAS